ncbi:MAG: hypothetical protein QXZ51_00790 [Candidatus Bathyarchaeia archaeon]
MGKAETVRVVEKAYKYVIPTPKELFSLFKEKFVKAKLPESWQVSEPWTRTLLNIFSEIGRSFGYKPRKEYLRLDQTWEIRHEDISVIVLALEHENTGDIREILDDELQKLVDVKAYLKVLIFYPSFPISIKDKEPIVSEVLEIQDKIRSAKIKYIEEKYVVIGITYNASKNVIEVSAVTLNCKGEGGDLGNFEIKYTSKEDIVHARYDESKNTFFCLMGNKKHNSHRYNVLEIVKHLRDVHGISPEDQVIEGWKRSHQKEWEKHQKK